ncbi:hypothetical protein DMB68_02950 [Flavobacterium hydrophilum]|uniref:Transmembrane protein n=1 Tax=Flavobacterium hydrophilum TaxID=2211445 RepID=A0A2V4C497_9FLAO|nr:hypothetical protein DMB68_02950 [Flavobacterium hydrophilum]
MFNFTHCILKLKFFILYSLFFILYSLFFILYSLFFILYSLFFILYSLFFILYSNQSATRSQIVLFQLFLHHSEQSISYLLLQKY